MWGANEDEDRQQQVIADRGPFGVILEDIGVDVGDDENDGQAAGGDNVHVRAANTDAIGREAVIGMLNYIDDVVSTD